MTQEKRDHSTTKAAALAALCMAAIVALFSVYGCGSDQGGTDVAQAGQPAAAGGTGAQPAQPVGADGDAADGQADGADPGGAPQDPAPAAGGSWGPKPSAPGWDKEYMPQGEAWKTQKQELVFNNGADIETLDPAIVTGVPEHRIFMAVYEGMVILDPKTTAPRPGVAETWTISPDGRTYRFTLRADAKWSDGKPVTAEDFRYSWYRVLAPTPPSQYAYMLYDIANAAAFNEGRIAETALPLHGDQACATPNGQKLAVGDVVTIEARHPEKFGDDATAEQKENQTWKVKVGDKSGWIKKKDLRGTSKLDGPGFAAVGIKVIDARTLEVTLSDPKQYFLDILAHQTAMPVQKANVSKFANSDDAFRPENFVGNGTHLLADFTPRKHIVMTKSPTYWNKGIVRLEKITALPIESMETAYTKFQADELDWMMSVPVTKIDEVKQDPDYYVAPYLGTYYYRINVVDRFHPDDAGKPEAERRKHPLTDTRIRIAINLAIDKTTLCDKVAKGGQIPATGYVPPGIPGYPLFEGLTYNRAKARELFAAAGYPEGKGFPKIEILYNTNEGHKKMAEAVAGMLEANLGIVVGLTNKEWKVYLDQVDRKDYDISRAGWIGDYNDPNTFMDMFVTDGGNNNTGWSHPEYDKMIDLARKATDAAKRMSYFQRAEQILCVEEFPIIPIYYYVNQGVKKPKVRGVYENIRDQHPWQYIWIEDEE